MAQNTTEFTDMELMKIFALATKEMQADDDLVLRSVQKKAYKYFKELFEAKVN